MTDRLRVDFQWTTPPAVAEPVSGMSESLAEGLVSRFIGQWRDLDVRFSARSEQPRTQKRAAAFRAHRDWLLRSVAPSLRILSLSTGAQSGKDKDATFALVYWAVAKDRACIAAAYSVQSARGAERAGVAALLTRHALVRLFQRLRTTDDTAVLYEAATGMRRYFQYLSIHRHVLDLAEILVPTEHGAFIIGADDFVSGQHGIVKTWMSDSRMVDTYRRIDAVTSARTEDGVVVCANGEFVVLSYARLGHRLGRSDILSFIHDELERRQRRGLSRPPAHRPLSNPTAAPPAS